MTYEEDKKDLISIIQMDLLGSSELHGLCTMAYEYVGKRLVKAKILEHEKDVKKSFENYVRRKQIIPREGDE